MFGDESLARSGETYKPYQSFEITELKESQYPNVSSWEFSSNDIDSIQESKDWREIIPP